MIFPSDTKPCSEACDGMDVTHIRHGDPMVHYRKCQHGRELKRLHSKMSSKAIRADVLAALKLRPSNVKRTCADY